MPSFDHRSQDIEIMDNLHCEGEVVDQTLRELEIINRLLGGNYVTISGVQALLKNTPAKIPITIADLGCGGGDILRLIATWGRKHNFRFQLRGIDANPNIIAFAINSSTDYPEIEYEPLNIFGAEFKSRAFDIVLATLFTHHFTDEELIQLFSSLKKQVRIGIVINDIHRHWFAFHSIRFLTHFFSKSAMVKYDAPLSVLRSFKKSELKAILQQAGIENYQLKWKWAFRWQLIVPIS